MKARPIIFSIALCLIPSLSFAEPKAEATISFHPLPSEDDLMTLSAEVERMEIANLSNDPRYKAANKKLESLKKQRDALDKQELKRQAAYNKCWAACPDVLYTGNDQYRCNYSQRCNQCGGNCNSRFIKAKEDMAKKQDKLLQQIMEAEDGELMDVEESYGRAYSAYIDEGAVPNFIGCINGVIDGKPVYKERTYTSLDECLKAQGWEPASKK